MGMEGIMEGKMLFLLTAQDVSGPPGAFRCSILILPKVGWWISHFTDEETEAQRR